MGSDGMTLDAQGNVYLTGDGVSIFDAKGKKIEHINIDEPWTANVTFGGRQSRHSFHYCIKGYLSIENGSKWSISIFLNKWGT